MRLLAIDTAREACTAAVLGPGDRHMIRSEIIGRGHGEALFPMIAAVMAEAGMVFAELERIAVVVGPGSFTGVRIGIAAARGFAAVHGTQLCGISTLAAHAQSAGRQETPLLALQEGRGGDAFGQLFHGSGEAAGEPASASLQHWAEIADNKGAALCGSGADAVSVHCATPHIILHRRSHADPNDLLSLAARLPASSEPLRPIYLKAPDATPRAQP